MVDIVSSGCATAFVIQSLRKRSVVGVVPNAASTAFVGLWTVMIEYSSVLDNLLQLADVAVYLLLLHLIVMQVALEILLVGRHVYESVA